MKVLIFGATGSAGGGILRACLAAPMVEEVRAVTRRPIALTHPRLRVITHHDFLDYSEITEAFSGVDACLFCLGISSTQVSGEAEYRRITHDMTLAAAEALHAASPDALFQFITGRGTKAESRFMWSRVKAETERELIDRFGAICWRPAAIGSPASASAPWYYKLLLPLIGLLSPFRNLYVSGSDFGKAMLQVTIEKMRGRSIENSEIRDIAARAKW